MPRTTLPLALLAALTLATPAPAQSPATPPAPQPNLRVTNDVRVYQAVKDAVVNIASTKIINARVGTGDPVFDRFFGPTVIRSVPTQSLGSGFIIHTSGYLITNEHVVDRAAEIAVILSDGTKHPATVIATDTEHDLAVLKINPPQDKPLPTITLGATEDLMVGEPVYAIGNPLGYAGSMTRGIVSAVNRELEAGPDKSYKNLIQTDASINPGNSGGPLLNAYGQVIGVNTAIRSDAQNIGFAISVSSLRDLLPHFLNAEALNRAQIGFDVTEKRTLTPPAAVTAQVLVKDVAANSPAAKAGLANGDHLTRVNNTPVNTIIDALVAIATSKPGDTLALQITRNGKPYQVKVPVTAAPPPESEVTLTKRLGIAGTTVTPALAKSSKLPVNTGILITQVDPKSPAATAGIEKGDILFQLGPYYVANIEDAATILKAAKTGTRVQVGIIRANTRARTILQLR